jgi:hypothetical protein
MENENSSTSRVFALWRWLAVVISLIGLAADAVSMLAQSTEFVTHYIPNIDARGLSEQALNVLAFLVVPLTLLSVFGRPSLSGAQFRERVASLRSGLGVAIA